MDLTGIFLFCLSLGVAAKTFSQTVTLSVKNASVQQVFELVKEQTHYSVFYEKDLLTGAKTITAKVRNMPLQQFLSMTLAEQDFTYYVEQETIFLKRKPISSMTKTGKIQEAEVFVPTVKGLVTGVDGKPLTGVNVVVKGSGKGTTTDAEGSFGIEVNTDQILVFSSIGFLSQEIAVSSSTMQVILVGETKSLNEVIVTALGIPKAVKSLTYTAQNVKGDQLNEAKEVNIVNALQGKVAGVTVTRNADGPGGDTKVLIRGNRSITGNNDPLYVIDGVPLTGSVGMLNSDDVENMTVLKGASAASLYGSQGQNGAIIITTKRGKEGALTVNYVGGLSFDKAMLLPDLQYEYGQGDAGIYAPNSEHSWGPKADGQMVTLWNGKTVPLKGQPDNLRNFFRTGSNLTNSVSITGGNEKMRTYFSYANVRAQGIMRNNDLIRHNVDLKIDNAISSKLTCFVKMTYIYEEVNNRVIPGDAGTYALPSIFRSPTSIPLREMENYAYTDSNARERQNYWKPNSSVLLNPFWALNRITYYQQKDRLLGLFSAKYAMAEGIAIQVRGSIDKTFQRTNHKVYADNYFSLVGSDYDYGSTINTGVNMDALLSFRRDLSRQINLSGDVGASMQESTYSGVAGNANGLNKQNFFFMNNARNPFINEYSGRTPRVQSLYGTVTVAYRNYLYLDVTARNDWSSALPKGSQSYFYPSVGFTGVISDMFRLPLWINYGKVRATFANSGYGGNEYLDRNYYQVGAGGVIITPTIESLGTYKPELTSSFETGVEGRLFNNRVSINVVYYNTKTKNQLLLIGAPPASTFNQKYINAGLIRNRGVEVVAGVIAVKIAHFSWNIDLNYSKNYNKVLQLTADVKSAILVNSDLAQIKAVEGNSFGDIYAKGWQQDDQGRKLVDDAGNPIFTKGNDVLVGNYNPNYMMGINNMLEFNSFSLGFLIDYRNGGYIIAGTQALIDADGHSRQSLQGRENGITLDAYTVDGKKNEQTISAQKYWSDRGGRYPVGSLYAYSATNVRLRELILGYIIPAKALGKQRIIKGAKVSFVGRNVFFFKNNAPIDPEITRGVGGGGLEYAALPSTRNLGVNLKCTF
jgi:TonB-linked SusC/RagA family outer membrane protein